MQPIIRAITTALLTTLLLASSAWAESDEKTCGEAPAEVASAGDEAVPNVGAAADGTEAKASDGEAQASDGEAQASDGEAKASDSAEVASEAAATAARDAAATHPDPSEDSELKQPVIYVPPSRGTAQTRVGGATRGGEHPL